MNALRSRDRRLVAPIVLAALVVATVAAMIATQRVRRHGLVLDKIKVTGMFDPEAGTAVGPDCDFSQLPENPVEAQIRFRLTRAETVDVAVVDVDGNAVRSLADDEELADHKLLCFHWDGAGDDGELAAPGTYSLRFVLHRRDRTITPSERMTLVEPGTAEETG